MIDNLKKFKNIPVNLLLIILAAIFIFQVWLVMFYNNGIITFSNKFSFYSLNRAADFADTNFTLMKFDINYSKEINGVLYPFFVSFLYKIAGQKNIIPVLYVVFFIFFFIITIIYYLVSEKFLGREYSLFSTIIFMTSAPVIISLYSGADVIVSFLLVALNIYFLFFNLENKEYKGALITAFLLFFCGFTAMIFGFISLLYIFFFYLKRKLQRNYYKLVSISVFLFILICSIFLSFIFLKEQDLQKTPLVDTKTFFVDTFFKDGFLWSKMFMPFLGIFFYIGIFIKTFDEFKNKTITFNFYSLLFAIYALLLEFFSTFSKEAETVFFVSPFYFIFILYACYGIFYLVTIILKNKTISKNNLILGIFIFVLLYNIIITFNKTVEQNNNIRFISNEFYVQKFMEK